MLEVTFSFSFALHIFFLQRPTAWRWLGVLNICLFVNPAASVCVTGDVTGSCAAKKKKKKLRVGRLIRFYSFSWENLISLLISLTQDSTGVIFASKEQQYLFYVLWRRRPLEGPLTLNCLYQTHISCLPVQIAKNA